MGFIDAIKDQFIDVIEYIDEDMDTIVKKYERPYSNNNEIKTGSKVIVRPSQAAVFFKGGQFADILKEGTHKITTDNLPVLSSIIALPYLFNSPIKADLYFISLKQFVGNNWFTKNPIILRDKELKMVRVKLFGVFAFKVTNVETFIREVLGTQRKFDKVDLVNYLSSYLIEAFSDVVGEVNIPIIDLASQYSKLADLIQLKANIKAKNIGIKFSDVIIENISLPENVEKLIDEQSGIGMASQDMDEFIQYQSARAIRDAAQQSGGIAGLGASIAVGKKITETMTGDEDKQIKIRCKKCRTLNGEKVRFCYNCGELLIEDFSKTEKAEEITLNNNDETYKKLVEYKKMLDDGILTQEEYNEIKKKLLN